ncbi:extracellular serine protease [Stenotrophomonas acidaminiphila]|uniref:Extracellular serine protease n=1 Tax=Stenotrophomonas acidaminiphila TaxID=128780 RepID=A0A0S1AY46_9GAMM|nr:autotransporter serine protease [Stenotrophomonas acidaminiphila]ALJ27719.1 extracellular serine protease [Stenotrophomonas acidaminiphila]
MRSTFRGHNALAASMALALAACGGGGGSKSSPPPPPNPPPTSPPPTTTTPQPAMDAHLALTNARAAQAAGFTGAGIRIGVVDSGVMRNHPTLAGRVVANFSYVDPRRNNLAVDDVVGHGTTVAQLAAGAAAGQWPGGIAPGAQIVSARIINDERPKDDGSGQGNEVTGGLGMSGVHDDLIRAGVRIMNNSWGGLYWTRPTVTAQIAAEYRPFIVGNDGLVVFATGNESRANPSDMAALPRQPGENGSRPAADLERGWLAVAALDTANPSRLADYSNACGVARNYCLVAPGTSAFVGPNATASNLSYYYGSGTSYAAPLVSGAAALVWQAFPYFDNNLVRQTLLGTATDLGDPGPDAVFGYGLLNVGKAVKGPARFDWGDVTVDVNQLGLGSVWSNDISGTGGLIKRGPGALTLTGTNTYSGQTRIELGMLALRDGASIRSDVNIGGPASPYTPSLYFMEGNNKVIGNVDSAGNLYVMNGNSSATIQGNYVQQKTARMIIALGIDALHVTGTATLQGGRVLVDRIVPGYVPQDGTRQGLIRADGGLSGQFDMAPAATQNAGLALLQADYGYDSHNAWLDLQQVSVTAAAQVAGADATAMAAAQRVQQAFELLDGDVNLRSGAFAAGAGALQRGGGGFDGLGASLRSLTGEAHALALAMTFDSIDMNRRALSAQFGEGGSRADGAWSRSLGGGGQGGYAGGDYRLGGWMLGRETGMGDARVGFAFGQMQAQLAGGEASDRGRDRQTQARFYAGRQWGQAYALGQIGFGGFQRELDRGLLLGGERAGVMARYDGRFLSGSAEAGYRFDLGRGAFTPYLGADYARIDSDAFQEQGGYGFGLSAGGWHSSQVRAMAGMRGSYRWHGLELNGYAEWQQALSAGAGPLQARFTGIDAWAPLYGLQPARAAGLFGVSLDAWLARDAQLSLGYDQRLGGRGDNRQLSLRFMRGF